MRAGHDVVAVAAPGGVSPPPEFEVIEVERRRRSLLADLSFAGRVASAGRIPGLAERVYWSFPENKALLRAAESTRAELYLANDWRTLPVGRRAAATNGSRYAYDSQEWAVEEFVDNWRWRAVFPRYVRSIEDAGVPGAALVTTSSDGVADDLRTRYGLRRQPAVIRNVPHYEEVPFRTTGSPLVVLYHGQFMPNRGLDQLVESVDLWPEDRVLHLRGYATHTYVSWEEQLRRRAAKGVAEGRIVFHPRAPSFELVGLAAQADVGIHPLIPYNKQTLYSLPNKLFEYVMAGLAVCVTDTPGMAPTVREHDVGVLLPSVEPAAIAETVAALDRRSVDQWKRNSLAAARTLCWENEQRKLVDAVGRLAIER